MKKFICVFFCLLCFGLQSAKELSADQLQVASVKMTPGYNDALETTLVVQTQHELPDHEGNFVKSTINVHFPGAYRPIGKLNHAALFNPKHQALAVAFKLTDDRSQVYLVLLGQDGQVLVIPDLNAVAERLCKVEHERFDPVFVMPKTIKAHSITLTAGPYNQDCFEVTLRFSETGTLTLKAYKQLKSDRET